jgi:hypothetical protein
MGSSARDLPLLWRAGRGKKYPVKVSGVEIVPDPVQAGKLATFKISASTGMAAADSADFALPSADLYMLHGCWCYWCGRS